jgi:hypothetical protein
LTADEQEHTVGDDDLLLVFSNPVEGRDEEYNTWYDEVHLDDLKRIPGVVAATRYEFVPKSFPITARPTEHRYLAVYTLDRDADEVLGELLKRAGGPEMRLSEALDTPNVATSVWRRRSS